MISEIVRDGDDIRVITDFHMDFLLRQLMSTDRELRVLSDEELLEVMHYVDHSPWARTDVAIREGLNYAATSRSVSYTIST